MIYSFRSSNGIGNALIMCAVQSIAALIVTATVPHRVVG